MSLNEIGKVCFKKKKRKERKAFTISYISLKTNADWREKMENKSQISKKKQQQIRVIFASLSNMWQQRFLNHLEGFVLCCVILCNTAAPNPQAFRNSLIASYSWSSTYFKFVGGVVTIKRSFRDYCGLRGGKAERLLIKPYFISPPQFTSLSSCF